MFSSIDFPKAENEGSGNAIVKYEKLLFFVITDRPTSCNSYNINNNKSNYWDTGGV